ncbi:uncharacterized protein YALI1_E19845g [Yarrowia lipolytica]|uniref:Uncharacterized protein n=1 Tax=Yarrowia lipolytica TaxID=4952 RepID=A0A1D8NIQ1_YARLL|nr:hypothetical protein YALI1_E19845g [Yarrowia lipolytica]
MAVLAAPPAPRQSCSTAKKPPWQPNMSPSACGRHFQAAQTDRIRREQLPFGDGATKGISHGGGGGKKTWQKSQNAKWRAKGYISVSQSECKIKSITTRQSKIVTESTHRALSNESQRERPQLYFAFHFWPTLINKKLKLEFPHLEKP